MFTYFNEKEKRKMKIFKKSLSVMLALVIALSAFSVVSFAAENDDELKIGVCSDIHTVVVPEEEETYSDAMFGNADSFVNMHTLSFAILDGCAKKVKENGGQYLFICGDITNNGTLEQYAEASKKLADVEEKYDLKILLVPGNHDYYEQEQEGIKTFREYFYNFGFDEATVLHDSTNSYVYDLNNKYTLIAVDTNKPGKTGDGMKEETYQWLYNQISAAQESGKEVIVMCHHPIMPHYLLGEIVTANFVLSNYRKVCEKLADMGVKYVFTGHSHLSDIAVYKSKLGNEVYDVNSPALVSSPALYRMVTFTNENVSFTGEKVTSIDTSLIPKGYSDEAYSAMQNDFAAYSDKHYSASANHIVKTFLDADTLLEMIGTPNDKVLKGIIGGFCDRANEVIFSPLYGEEGSFEAIAKKYKVSIPESNYETLMDVAIEVIRTFYGISDKSIDSNSAEVQLAVTGIGMLLTYAFSDVPNDVKFSIIDAFLGMAGVKREDLGIDLTEIVLKGSDNPEFAFKVVHSIIDPIINGMLVDEAPEDCDVILPAYGEVNTQMTVDGIFGIIKQIASFIKNLLEYIYTVLATALKW